MLYKEIPCPVCNGYGFISGCDENSIWSSVCSNCNGKSTIVVAMTNGDIIRKCNNEQLSKVYYNLRNRAIYFNGKNNRLLPGAFNRPEEFLLWLNKEADELDIRAIFDCIDEKDFENPYTKASN